MLLSKKNEVLTHRSTRIDAENMGTEGRKPFPKARAANPLRQEADGRWLRARPAYRIVTTDGCGVTKMS